MRIERARHRGNDAGAGLGRDRDAPDHALAFAGIGRDIRQGAPGLSRDSASQQLHGAELLQFLPERRRPGFHRGRRALDADQRLRPVGAREHAARGRRRQMRGAAGLVRAVEGAGHRRDGSHIVETGEHERSRLLRRRQHLDADLGQHRERAVGARHQLREVVAGDVLHHATAGLELLAAAAHGVEAQEMIAGRALLYPARTREIAEQHAAEGLLLRRGAHQRTPVAGLEGQHLLGLGEQALDLRERRRRTGGEHQLLGLIAAHAGEARGVQHVRRLHRPAEAALGAVGDHLQGLAFGDGPGDELCELAAIWRAEAGHGRGLRSGGCRGMPPGRGGCARGRARRSGGAWETPCRD